MKYFIDTEFNEDGKTIMLISLAMVCEDGRELYLINSEARKEDCNAWVQEHVWPHLEARVDQHGQHGGKCNRSALRHHVERFVSGDPSPEFWGYFADYDWVVFCWLWGAMVDLPDHFPKYCLDLKQMAVTRGVAKPRGLVPPELPEHHALADARWNAKLHSALMALDTEGAWSKLARFALDTADGERRADLTAYGRRCGLKL